MRALGCDVVFLTDHSGLDGSSSYGNELPYVENASNLVAEQVAGIDAILVGHTHLEVVEELVDSKVTRGKKVLLTKLLKWGMRLSVMDLDLAFERGAGRSPSI